MTATQVVLVAVIGLVFWYWVRCGRLVWRRDNPRARLGRLSDRLKSDIRTLVKSGRSLDWVHYADEAHRGQEDLREHLRNYGTISLATGVGGTMAALGLHLRNADVSQGDALEQLLGEMGLALGASFMGVVGNLVILWGLLPKANSLFNPELNRFLKELRDQETRSATREALGPTAAATIGDRLGEELRIAIARVPKVFEQFGETVTTLGAAADKLDADVTQLTSASENLAQSTASLDKVPEELDTVLSRALNGLSSEADTLRTDLRTLESKRRSAAAESQAKLQSAIANATAKLAETNRAVQKSVDALPGKVAVTLETSGKSLGRQFDNSVEKHVKGFRVAVAEGLNKTMEWQNAIGGHLEEARKQHDRAIIDLLARTTDVATKVKDLPGAVADGVERSSDRIGREFGHEAHQHVAQLRSDLQKDARELRRRLERHESHLLNTTVQELRKVSEELVNNTVRDLEGVSEKLAVVLDGFPEHVEAVNTRLDDAEAELKDLLARFGEASSGLRAAYERTGELLAQLAESAAGQEEAIRKLTEAVRERSPWWRRLFRRSRAKARGRPRSRRVVRRYRTRTTAWPAVADLMTALAVVGLACALIVAGRDPPPDWPDLRAEVDSLKTEVASVNSQNNSLWAAVDSLERELARSQVGFLPCWRGEAPGEPRYYRTYDITVVDGRFSLGPHPHWTAGSELRDTIPLSLLSILEDFPKEEMDGEDMVRFGERVNDAVQAAGIYAEDCKLAVTVNTDATDDILFMRDEVGFFPVL